MSAGPKEPGQVQGAKVFITYRREETAGHAGRLYDAMVARFGEDNVFMDVVMAPGVDFVKRITEAVAACHVLIVVMGPRWATVQDEQGRARLADPEDFVRLEVETALQRPEVTPIPVLVAGARMPNREDLPPELGAIARRNALELDDHRWRYDVGRLISTLDELLAESPLAPSPSTPERDVATGKAAPSDAGQAAGQPAPPSTVAGPASRESKPAAAWAGGGRRLRWALLGAMAIAAIVVVVVLTADRGGGNGAADGGGDTSANQETGEYQTLVNSLPTSIRPKCENHPPPQWMVENVDARAQANCEAGGEDYLTYGLWGSPTKARDWLLNQPIPAGARDCRPSTETKMEKILPQGESGCRDIVTEGVSKEGIIMAWNDDGSPLGGFFQLVDNHDQDAALNQWKKVVNAP